MLNATNLTLLVRVIAIGMALFHMYTAIFGLMDAILQRTIHLLLSFLLPQKWTSQAIVTPAESVQWQGLERTLTALRVLDMEVSVDRGAAYLICLLKSLARPRCWKNIFVLLRMSWIN
mgnify:CR=1 FL=1